MERNVDVTTGESVVFSYELAGLGSRFYAVAIDLAIQIAVAVAALLLLAWVGSGVKPHAGDVAPAFEKTIDAIAIGMLSVAAFLLFFGYFIVFEWRFNGRTPGKRLLGIRVVRDGGFPLDFTSAVIRNVVRILEIGLGFYAISAIATLTSPANRRLGDMAAGTIVVRENRFERAEAPDLASITSATRGRADDDAVVADLTANERDLIRRYAARRPKLSVAARNDVAADIASTVRPKLAVPFTHLDDDDLLVHLATTALGESGGPV